MKPRERLSTTERVRKIFVGKARDLKDENIFEKVTLVAIMAWVGLGSDGLSSSCYGPEEAYRALGNYHGMTIFIAFAVVLTIAIISSSYSQIIKLFPSGGGGYQVASKLLSPRLGMISGSSLIVDYVLTISISIASGVDAIFSNFPASFQIYKLWTTLVIILILLLLNLRGVKESVFSLMPIFIIFLLTHVFAIVYPIFFHTKEFINIVPEAAREFRQASNNMGTFAVLLILARAYSMGAGTYTGIEAVSNSMVILKEPRVKTGIATMRLMAFSLGITVLGLLTAYSLFHLKHIPGKTMNANLLEAMTAGWNKWMGDAFVIITLLSEAALLFVGAQTGFLGGPRVISNMAQDRWFPRRFSVLSDRLVTQNGLILMAVAASFVLLVTGGKVATLVVLYSINVFITFTLSQAGMVRHWWQVKKKEGYWIPKLLINGLGLLLTVSILFTVVFVKFGEGGWLTILITSSLIFFVVRVRNHYDRAAKLLSRLDTKMLKQVEGAMLCWEKANRSLPEFKPDFHTACICVNDFNGVGINTFLKIREDFENYRNFIFISVGMLDTGTFRGEEELQNLEDNVRYNLGKYEELARAYGCFADSFFSIGTDVADEVKELSKKVVHKYHRVIFFVGNAIFARPSSLTRMLHNQTQLTLQNRLAHKGFMMVMIPVKLTSD
ncbi:MAG: APC family permease [Bacteroidetes bacterium]|nr:MAG: APC family permease [Bacteroidota bacterium]